MAFTVSRAFEARTSAGACGVCMRPFSAGDPACFLRCGAEAGRTRPLTTGEDREYRALFRAAQVAALAAGVLPRRSRAGRALPRNMQRPASLSEAGLESPPWLFDHMICAGCVPEFAGGRARGEIVARPGERTAGAGHGARLDGTTPALPVATVPAAPAAPAGLETIVSGLNAGPNATEALRAARQVEPVATVANPLEGRSATCTVCGRVEYSGDFAVLNGRCARCERAHVTGARERVLAAAAERRATAQRAAAVAGLPRQDASEARFSVLLAEEALAAGPALNAEPEFRPRLLELD